MKTKLTLSILACLLLGACSADDPFINPAMQEAHMNHLNTMSRAMSTPTPSMDSLARLKSANFQTTAPR